jgi:hypothetical protein
MNEDIEEKPLESSASEGDNQSTPPVDKVADEASRESSDAGSSPRKPTRRELLVKELSQPKPEKAEVDEKEDEDTEEGVEGKEPKAEVVEDQEAEGEPKPAGDASKHDTSDRRSKAREAFEKLTTHNRELKTKLDEAEPFAAYGKSMFQYCKDAGISTEKLGLWLAVAADAEKNPAGARTHLEKLGLKVEPVREVVAQVPEGLEDALLDMATSGRLEPEAFKSLRDMIRKAKATAAAPVQSTPAPVPNQPVAQTRVPSAAPQAVDPQKAVYDRNLAKAVADINEREDELATKYPADWPKMKAQISEAFKRYRGTDPTLWKGFFEDELNKVVAKAKRPATPPSQSTQIRPSSTSSASKAPPSKLAALKADIVAGKVR